MKHDHVLAIGNLGFSVNNSSKLHFTNENPDSRSGVDVNNDLTIRRRKIDDIKIEAKIISDYEYPGEDEL